MNKVILVLEDSLICQNLILGTLKNLAQIKMVSTIKEARNFLKNNKTDLIVLDLKLPDGNGLDFFGEMQINLLEKTIPTIVVSSDNDLSRKITAFSNGAYDYIVKPYIPLELRARVQRIINESNSLKILSFEKLGLELNLEFLQAFQVLNNKREQLALTPNEFRILTLLIRNSGRIFSRQQIVDKVWGVDVFITPRTIDTHVSSLRKKLKLFPLIIQSARGEGYKLEER